MLLKYYLRKKEKFNNEGGHMVIVKLILKFMDLMFWVKLNYCKAGRRESFFNEFSVTS